MDKYKAYPEYKDSGVEWLGAIPKNWQLSKLRYQFAFDKGLTITKENLQDEGVPCVNYGEVHSKYGFEVDPQIHPLNFVSHHYIKSNPSSLLMKGDIVFADTSEDIDGSGNFTQLISDVTTFAGYHTIIARPLKRESSRFYAYLLDCNELRTQVRHTVKGVKVFSITQAILRGLSIWLPSEKEQKCIAAFLDHETAKIDKLIEKQQQLIELLKEKRQAVISHAVTKGLNPDVPMKDSGVEWLGEVPEHWSVSKLKYYSSIQGGFAFNSDDFTSEGIQVLRIGNLYQNKLELDRQPVFLDANGMSKFREFAIYKNDILISLTGTLGKRDYGFAIKVDKNDAFLLNQRVAKFYPDEEKLPRNFLLYLLWSDSYLNQLYSLPSGTKQANLSNSNVIDIFVAVPPTLSEQISIIKKLNVQMAAFDSVIKNSLSLMELLYERRTSLISAAVTGKIDVRDWVAPEKQDVEEPQETTA